MSLSEQETITECLSAGQSAKLTQLLDENELLELELERAQMALNDQETSAELAGMTLAAKHAAVVKQLHDELERCAEANAEIEEQLTRALETTGMATTKSETLRAKSTKTAQELKTERAKIASYLDAAQQLKRDAVATADIQKQLSETQAELTRALETAGTSTVETGTQDAESQTEPGTSSESAKTDADASEKLKAECAKNARLTQAVHQLAEGTAGIQTELLEKQTEVAAKEAQLKQLAAQPKESKLPWWGWVLIMTAAGLSVATTSAVVLSWMRKPSEKPTVAAAHTVAAFSDHGGVRLSEVHGDINTKFREFIVRESAMTPTGTPRVPQLTRLHRCHTM